MRAIPPPLKRRNVKARGEAPGNPTPTPSPALKGRHNRPFRFAPSGRGEDDWGAPTQGFTLGFHITGFQPSGTAAALKGRHVKARGEAPGNPTPTPSPALKGRHNRPFGFALSGRGEDDWGAPTQGFTLGFHITGFQPSGTAAALKGRHVTARGEAPGNPTPPPSPALKGRHNRPFGFAPSGRGEDDWGAPTQGFTQGSHITGFQPSGTAAIKGRKMTALQGREVAARGKSPRHVSPTPSVALKGRHVTARGEAPGNPTPPPSPALKGRPTPP